MKPAARAVMWVVLALCAAGASAGGGARAAAAAAAGTAAADRRQEEEVTPVQKVIQMLGGMLAKGKEEKHAEAVQFATYKQFCSDTEAEKTRAVQVADEQIESLKAGIQMAQTSAETLKNEVMELEAQTATWQADEKAAAKVRETERSEYLKVHQDYSDTIDAVTKAMQMLKSQAYNRKQASAEETSALAQVSVLQKVPEGTKRVLAAFLARSSSAEDPADGEAYAYEFRSGGVQEMLQKLKDKFIEERSQLEKEETNKRHAYELLAQDLQASVKNAEESVSAKTQQKAKELQKSSQMTGELTDTTSTRADDAKYLAEMTAICKQKAGDFEERQKLRADEIIAIDKAIEILSSDTVKGHAETYLPSLVQGQRALLQTASAGRSPNQMKAADYLSGRASELGSKVLSGLALRVSEDPFAKVKKMVQDLITRLQDQSVEEAQHEAWCKTELSTNEQVRTSRQTTIDRLHSEIDEKKSTVAKLASEITEHSQQLTDLDKTVADQTEMRTKEKAANEQTIKDAQEAQTAVSQAVTVLKEFYSSAAEATALVQRKGRQEPAAPAIFEGAYQGMGTESGGVIGMLEVIQSDFARLESETSAAEETSQNEHEKQMSDSAVLKAQLQKDVEHNTLTKQQAEQALVDLNNDLLSTEKELAAANAYYEKLKPSCLDAGSSTEERAQRRKEEIESLKEALRILNGEDIAMQ